MADDAANVLHSEDMVYEASRCLSKCIEEIVCWAISLYGQEVIDNALAELDNRVYLAIPRAVKLSPAEMDIVEVIRRIGPAGCRSQKAILDALAAKGTIASEGTTKVILAALVRHGILAPGYRLPEWE